MNETTRIQELARRMARQLHGNILPFWLRLEDRAHGGHYGLMDAAGRLDRAAPKAAVFVSRLLWTLATAGAATGDERCLAQAGRTKAFLLRHLVDPAQGGVFWSVTHDGQPLETDKHAYAQAFAIYGLSAYAAATGDAAALAAAQAVFADVERHARQPGGEYREAFDADWRPVPNRRLAPQGDIDTLTANTHLHLIEAYTGLARAWPAPAPRAALRGLVEFFVARFLADDGSHSHPLLDGDLRPLAKRISYSHDIELSWLIEAAGDVLGDGSLARRLRAASARLAAFAAAHGQDADGGWSTDSALRGRGTRHWWVQAEAMLGMLNAVRRGGPAQMLDRAEATWAFVERVVVDQVGGDWFGGVDRMGQPDPTLVKVGPWKDCYHQARACLLAGSVGA